MQKRGNMLSAPALVNVLVTAAVTGMIYWQASTARDLTGAIFFAIINQGYLSVGRPFVVFTQRLRLSDLVLKFVVAGKPGDASVSRRNVPHATREIFEVLSTVRILFSEECGRCCHCMGTPNHTIRATALLQVSLTIVTCCRHRQSCS